MKICVLGRQPELGLAELEALYGPKAVKPCGEQCALVDADVDFARLGGSVKAADVLLEIARSDTKTVLKHIAKLLPDILKSLPTEGKIKLGLSAYGFDLTPYQLGGEALRLKKILRGSGRSVRVVPNETPALSSAQTFHNRLFEPLGIELALVRDGKRTIVGRVTNVQDIDSYRVRDRERPKRDAFVGMLPPKLAQIIVNLAVGPRTTSFLDTSQDLQQRGATNLQLAPSGVERKDGGSGLVILDPFCGTGVVLQEAALMGYATYGTDISERMVRASRDNVNWLQEKHAARFVTFYETADATIHTWRQPVDAVASETYLGQPLGGQQPTKEKFAEIVHDTNTVVSGFLANIVPQLSPGTRLCLAVPAWYLDGTTTRLPVVQELAQFGLTVHTFSHVVAPMIYHRESQVTGRELLVLTKE